MEAGAEWGMWWLPEELGSTTFFLNLLLSVMFGVKEVLKKIC